MASQHKISIIVDGDSKGAQKALGDITGGLDSFADRAGKVGGALTAGITAPLLGVAAGAIKMSTDLSAAMANVASLGVPTERVLELKTAVQDLAIETGKSTGDLAEGLYNIISAFGDSADAVKQLEINAKLAAAGLATTDEAIALTSAVTKAYGDTSAEAMQKAADLALETVKLGQTTLPELAASYGKVTPLAVALGVSQEELAAQFATFTGVTGNTAEVATQMRATFQSLLKPTSDMAAAISEVSTTLDVAGRLVEDQFTLAWKDAKAELHSTKQAMADLDAQIRTIDPSTKAGAAAIKELEKQYKALEKSSVKQADAIDAAAAAMGSSIVASVGYNEALSLLAGTAEGNTDTLGKMFGSVEAINLVLALSGEQADTLAEKYAAMMDVTGSMNEAFDAQTQGINKVGFTMAQLSVMAQVLMERLGDGLAPALAIVLEKILPFVDGLLNLATQFANADPATQTFIVGIAAVAAAIGPVIMGVGLFASGLSALLPVLGAVGGALALLVSPIVLVAAGLAALIALDVGGIRTGIVAVFNEAAAAFTAAGGGLAGVQAALEAVLGVDLQPFVDGLTSAWEAVLLFKDEVLALATGEISFDAFVEKMGLSGFVTSVTDAAAAVTDYFGPAIERITEALGTFSTDASGMGDSLSALATAAQEAFTAMWSAVQPILIGLGAAVTVAGLLITNTFGAAISNLGPVLQATIDQMTATLTFFSTTVTALVTGITALINGDWAGAWTAFGSIPRAGITLLRTSLTNLATVLASLIDTLGTGLADTLADLGFESAAVSVRSVTTQVRNLVMWLGKLTAGKITITVPDWITTLLAWDWPEFPAIPGWLSGLLDWDWPSFPSAPGWVTNLTKWEWPSFPRAPGWLSDLLNWSWPSMPQLPGWLGGGSGTPGNASGTRFWRGGLTWVGEEGPELVNLPRGSQVFNSQRQMAMAGVGGGSVVINNYVTVRDELDIQSLTDKTLRQIERRRP